MGATAFSASAFAQGVDSEQLRRELGELKRMQAEFDARIASIEAQLAGDEQSTLQDVDNPAASASAPTAEPPRSRLAALDIGADLLLRYEGNFSDADSPDRERAVMRARLHGSYDLGNGWRAAAMLETGDPDDPNSGYLTVSDFADGFEISLSQAYAERTIGGLTLRGGKVPQPFLKTDLLWDGDVNPAGVSAVYTHEVGGSSAWSARGLYFVVDENAGGADSDMVGGQLTYSTTFGSAGSLTLASGYYDYRLGSLAGADAGDFRSNLREANGAYISDFEIVDVIADLKLAGFSDRWPLRITGDYVHNTGSATDADTAYGLDVALGRVTAAHDYRFTYGYSQAEADAVFAAFSHDNLGIATNYESHKLVMDYLLDDGVSINATWYHYKPLQALYAGLNDPDDWLDRVRLNLVLAF